MSIPFSLAIARTFAIAAPCPVSSPDLLAKNITRHAAGEMAAATSAAAVTTNPSTRTGTSLSLASRIAPTSAAISAPPSFASAAPAVRIDAACSRNARSTTSILFRTASSSRSRPARAPPRHTSCGDAPVSAQISADAAVVFPMPTSPRHTASALVSVRTY